MSVPPKVARAVAPVRRRVDALRARVVDTMLWQVWERLLENEFIDRGVALAAKAFVSLFPALIVVDAFLPASMRESVSSTVSRRAGLSGDGLTTVKQAFASSDDVRRATGFLGLLLTFFYINSFVTALQRVYVKAWRRPKTGRAAAYAIGAAWLVSLVAYFALLGTARALLHGGATTPVFLLFAYLVTTATWVVTPWIMLQREVRFRALL